MCLSGLQPSTLLCTPPLSSSLRLHALARSIEVATLADDIVAHDDSMLDGVVNAAPDAAAQAMVPPRARSRRRKVADPTAPAKTKKELTSEERVV
jgi:hypothetical protein